MSNSKKNRGGRIWNMFYRKRKERMRVWILDDKHFPTGYANRWIEKHPELKKVSLRLEYMDVAGPEKECALLANRLDAEESYVSIVAWKRNVNGVVWKGICKS
ncbi:MAG: hypothetical protein ACLR2E_19210 [Lachnospiraceae bacterium]